MSDDGKFKLLPADVDFAGRAILIHCEGRRISDADIDEFCTQVRTLFDDKLTDYPNNKLPPVSIDLQDNFISAKGIVTLRVKILDVYDIQNLYLDRNSLNDVAAHELSDWITTQQSCEQLHVSGNKITDAGLAHLLTGIISCGNYPLATQSSGKLPLILRLNRNHLVCARGEVCSVLNTLGRTIETVLISDGITETRPERNDTPPDVHLFCADPVSSAKSKCVSDDPCAFHMQGKCLLGKKCTFRHKLTPAELAQGEQLKKTAAKKKLVVREINEQH